MTIFQAAVLGLIQGLTEFLPVSSSGHLVLMQQVFGITEPVLAFDIAVHVGTLLAVCIYFFNDLKLIVRGLFSRCATWAKKKPLPTEEKKSLQLTALIVLGSIPTAIIGLLFSEIAHTLYSSVFVVGCMLLITGTFLWMTERAGTVSQKTQNITWQKALGIDRTTAVRFSFLLSIPGIIGAALLTLLDAENGAGMDLG